MEFEAERQTMHTVFGLVCTLMFIYIPVSTAIEILFVILTASLILALIHHRRKMPGLERFTSKFERHGETRVIGEAAIKFIIGVLISALVFFTLNVDNRAIIGAVAALAVGDSTSTIIGKKFGNTKLFGGKKSIEGIIAGAFVSSLALAAFLPVQVAVPAALIGMFAELLPINDNYTIPLATGITIALLL